jgi:hypothetical protein
VLTNKEPRCAGIYVVGLPGACPDRDRCLRYLHFLRLDREAGIENYQGIFVMMAVRSCNLLIEGMG